MYNLNYQLNGIPQTIYTNIENFEKNILFEEEKKGFRNIKSIE